MAVEARRFNFSHPQLLANRELMNPIEANDVLCNTNMGYGNVLSTTEPVPFPFCGTADNVLSAPLTSQTTKPATLSVNSNSNGNYDLPLPSRKRSRDYVNNNALVDCGVNTRSSAPFSFLGQDISSQIQKQQLEIDRLIALHMERVKFEIEERRKREAMTLIEAIEQGLMKKLRAREEERVKIGRLNHALEERVKSLFMENQLWRDLAQSNEARANALRSSLEQVMAQAKDVRNSGAGLDDTANDAQSFCGSCPGEDGAERRTVAGDEKDKGTSGKREGTSTMCRNCGEEESCVLLLPCRHLCLCALCGSHLHVCPICKSPNNGSFRVNMSPMTKI